MGKGDHSRSPRSLFFVFSALLNYFVFCAYFLCHDRVDIYLVI
jgi:hypothetical protein